MRNAAIAILILAVLGLQACSPDGENGVEETGDAYNVILEDTVMLGDSLRR